MAAKLSEIVRFLTEEKPDGTRLFTQTSLGVKLGTNQSAVSQMLIGRQWDDHFEIILKLIPLGLKYDFIEERDLLTRPSHDRRTNPSSNKANKAKTG